MRVGKIVRTIVLVGVIGVVSVIAYGLIGWRPRFGLEGEFQRVISEAQIADHYRGTEGGGWDSEDVTSRICDRVDRDILNGLGIPVDDRTHWPTALRGSTSKPEDIWKIYQDKGLIASCRDHSMRFLEIGIDRQTSACTARVAVLPTCDP